MKNQMEKNMENEMETGSITGVNGDNFAGKSLSQTSAIAVAIVAV